MDLFKAIFENSEPSSSSSSSNEASDEEDKQQIDADSQRTADSLNAAVDGTKTDMASETVSATVSDATPVTLELPVQQQTDGMMILDSAVTSVIVTLMLSVFHPSVCHLSSKFEVL